MIELRDYKRLDWDGKVRLRTGTERPRVFRAYLDDISFGGFQICAKKQLSLGDDIDFKIMTRLLNYILTGKGKVRHISPMKKGETPFFTIGAEFTDINKKEIITLIDKILWYKNISAAYRQSKRKSVFVLKALPFIIIITWSVLKFSDMISASMDKDRLHAEKYEQAIMHYLYHSH